MCILPDGFAMLFVAFAKDVRELASGRLARGESASASDGVTARPVARYKYAIVALWSFVPQRSNVKEMCDHQGVTHLTHKGAQDKRAITGQNGIVGKEK